MKLNLAARLTIATIGITTSTASTGQSQTTVLRAARMITIESPAVVTNAVIVVTNDKIVAAGPASSVTVPSGAKVIDLGDVTLLPGFIDAHTHITGRTLGDPLYDLAAVRDYQGYGAIVGVA
ncbi:MAG: hypothetical protein ABIZ36_06480, partial [Gemmatimonadaceae bacterium]